MTSVDRACGGRALLLIDFQHDFLADDGRMPVARHHVAEALAAAGTCIATATTAGAVVIKIGNEFKRTDVVRNLLRRNAAIEGSDGAAWDPGVDAPSAVYVPKWRGDAFCNPQLKAALTEAGVFLGGSVTTNSGQLLSHVLISENKTSAETLTVEVTITVGP